MKTAFETPKDRSFSNRSNKITLFFLCSVALSFVVTVMRTVSLLTVYENDIGYYVGNAVLPKIQAVVIIISVIFSFSIFFIMKRDEAPDGRPSGSHMSTFSALLCATVHISSAALLILYQRVGMDLVTLLILIGFASAAIFYFYDGLCPVDKRSPFMVIPAIIAVIGLVAVIVKIHLDYTVTLNNPNKTMIFLSFGSVCLFIVQELRFTVGSPQPRFYVAISSIAMLLCSALSIPGIIGHYTNTLSGGDFLIYYIIAFVYAVYIFTRLLSYVKYAAHFSRHGDVMQISPDSESAE